ncbi:SRPBCC domain-containing protein [Arthrobacter sp. Cr_A7]|uniref:SRPBCC family protein n=1 Tax=Arthrobacter sp. Cr_A7 TaxID=3031017 RepID=UPI0023DCB901|nr:SRPBCC domain-containing protein [Arthrobacter sp. Cr_A7]MDF2049141.1 SRPBCC domain-containing protein [Arthrobacter sp. Cr_A7]
MTETTGTAADQVELTITRTFDAPREFIWAAYNDPSEIERWLRPALGREGVSYVPVTGQTYDYVWESDNGEKFPTNGTYLEVFAPERLVFTWGSPNEDVADQPVCTVDFTEEDGKTTYVASFTRLDKVPGKFYLAGRIIRQADLLSDAIAQRKTQEN